MKVLMVIAHKVFRDEEYLEPRQVLEERGVFVQVASSSTSLAEGKLGLTVKPDMLLKDADASDYDAVVFIGGAGAEDYFDDPIAHKLAREMIDAGKVAAAICIAPAILANSGILANKKVTAFSSVEEIIRKSGAIFTDEPTQKDGSIITANGPQAARKFGELIAETLQNQGT